MRIVFEIRMNGFKVWTRRGSLCFRSFSIWALGHLFCLLTGNWLIVESLTEFYMAIKQLKCYTVEIDKIHTEGPRVEEASE